MEQVTRQTVTTTRINPNSDDGAGISSHSVRDDGSSLTAQSLIYFIFGVLEFLLVFRFIFKLMGANPGSPFTSFVYNITAPFVAPFTGIFRQAVTAGAEVTSVFEPAILVAIAVYALISWAIVKLLAILSGSPEVT